MKTIRTFDSFIYSSRFHAGVAGALDCAHWDKVSRSLCNKMLEFVSTGRYIIRALSAYYLIAEKMSVKMMYNKNWTEQTKEQIHAVHQILQVQDLTEALYLPTVTLLECDSLFFHGCCIHVDLYPTQCVGYRPTWIQNPCLFSLVSISHSVSHSLPPFSKKVYLIFYLFWLLITTIVIGRIIIIINYH